MRHGDTAADRTAGIEWSQQYTPAEIAIPATHQEASPYYAADTALGDLPSTLMIVGDAEVMLSESTELAERARAAGADVTLSIYPRMWHVFVQYTEGCQQKDGVVVVEAEDAIEEVGRFVTPRGPCPEPQPQPEPNEN